MEEAHTECSAAPAFEGVEVGCTVGDGVGHLELVVAAHTGSEERLVGIPHGGVEEPLVGVSIAQIYRAHACRGSSLAFGQGCGVVVLRYDDGQVHGRHRASLDLVVAVDDGLPEEVEELGGLVTTSFKFKEAFVVSISVVVACPDLKIWWPTTFSMKGILATPLIRISLRARSMRWMASSKLLADAVSLTRSES